jgi:ADP-dependent NAD(P)H-hydrate dehydratase / NAD(P)H-hydrate epimerase
MQIIENNSEFLGVSHSQLMEVVGYGIAREVAAKAKAKPNSRIDVVSGTGKNGGDGLAVARHLASQGFRVRVTLVGRPKDVEDAAAKEQLDSILQMKDSVEFQSVPDSSQLKPFESDFIIDALLGTGVKGDLRQPLLGAVRIVNRSKGFKVAVDLPSGLDTDTGEPHGEAVKADLTFSLHRKKQGLLKAPGYTGELVALPMGIPPEAEDYAGPGDFKVLWKQRPPNAHKGDFGRLLVVGGSENFSGAPAFSALAATKCGTDLVYVASPEKTVQTISSYSPDLITIRLTGDHLKPSAVTELERWVKAMDAVVLGPGIGLHEDTIEFVWKTIALAESLNKPLVLDADAIKIFARRKRRLRTAAVLTPHAGEFAVVAQRKPGEGLELKAEAAEQLAKEIGATIILKGHVDVVTDGNRTKLNSTGNSFMTVGGTGDVLTGIVGGFLAQHIDPFRAAVAGAFLNGLAGDILIEEKGPAISPSQLVEYVSEAMKYCLAGPPYPSMRK